MRGGPKMILGAIRSRLIADRKRRTDSRNSSSWTELNATRGEIRANKEATMDRELDRVGFYNSVRENPEGFTKGLMECPQCGKRATIKLEDKVRWLPECCGRIMRVQRPSSN